MLDGIFDVNQQQKDLPSKIVVGLERVSEVFKVLLWERAKNIGLSPIQIQILLFCASHQADLRNVSHLAKEFNVTKPTISDAVKVLIQKSILEKEVNMMDQRAFSLLITSVGQKIVLEIKDFAEPIRRSVTNLSADQQSVLSEILNQLINEFHTNGLLTVQRMCFSCRFYNKNGSTAYCKFLQKDLSNQDIRLDCPEYETLN